MVTPPPARHKGLGRAYVVVIGIDRYRAWPTLGNAVQDARGALQAFEQLGFRQARPPLLDDAATGAALHRLVTDELATLGSDDSLVVFFAGHGHNVTTTFCDGTLTKRGYVIPVDAESPPRQSATWLALDAWLNEISQLPPKHILVILDACHSGVALDPVIRWRGEDMRLADPIEALRSRRSRRIITSALDDQLAQDCGPVAGHSLFTGCLIEALTGGLAAKTGQSITTGSELGLHIRQRVMSFPRSRQTPDFGALHLDNRGELIIELPPVGGARRTHGVIGIRPSGASKIDTRATGATEAERGARSGVHSIRSSRSRTAPTTPGPVAGTPVDLPVPGPVAGTPVDVPVSEPRRTAFEVTTATPPRAESRGADPGPASTPAAGPHEPACTGIALDAAFKTTLDRHDTRRKLGGHVLSLVTADPLTAATGWASWAASKGHLTLVTDAAGLDATADALLAQMPWLRALSAARTKLADAAGIEPGAVDLALDARSPSQREAWIDDISRHDLRARVSGWLLSALREPWAQVLDVKTAPVQGIDLLSILCGLAAPVTVLLHQAAPTAAWLARAIQTASELVRFLPHHAIAVGAPDELVERVVRDNVDSGGLALARQGTVPLAARPQPRQDPRVGRAEQLLHAALARNPRTAAVFEVNVQVPIHDRERAIEVDLVARDALLAVEIDDWYHYRDPQAYRRDRIKDVWLQRAGFFVMRFLAEDVEERLEQTVAEIALGLAGRRASGPLAEKAQ